jgi:hypothetical protein
MTPADRAARLRADLERLIHDLLDQVEDRFREELTEHETDVRREEADNK